MKQKIALVLLLAAILLTGCGKEQAEIRTLADMKDMSLAVGAPDHIDANGYILEVCPNAKIMPQNDVLYGIRSVSEGKLDAYVAASEYLGNAIREGNVNNVRVLEEPLIAYPCALGLSELCRIPEFESTVNETLERLISDGTIEEMRQWWFVQENEQMPEIKLDDDPEYTLNAVTYGQRKPYSFLKDGALTGFDVELLYRVCQQNHWGVKLSSAEYPSMLMGLSTGKYDMVSANLYVTQNKGDNTLFSVPYRIEEISAAVYGDSVPLSGEDDAHKPEYSTLSELQNAEKFAVLSGTIGDVIVWEHFPQAKVEYYQNVADCALALTNGKVDAFVSDAPSLQYLEASTEGVALMPEHIAKDDYYFLLNKSERGEQLKEEFNEWLSGLKQSGELDRIYGFWCSSEEPKEAFAFSALPNRNGTIRISTNVSGRPDTFYFNNEPTGYTLELIYRFCRDRGYGAELSVCSFEALIPSLLSEKTDFVVGFLSYTDERAQSVLYTDCVLEGGLGVLVRAVGNEKSVSLLDSFKSGLIRTFVTESRWKLIASGLGVTLLITLGGFALANLLGAAFCACTMSKRRGLQIFADVFDRIMQGTPMVVVLMILYYVIFGKSDISGIWVSILAFGMNSSASLARQFYGAVTGVDKGQTEAALAIGFTRLETFTGIVFPQAARIALPGYFSEIIGLMKGTAIVGYVAVIDLTKSGDLIRSSTYDAFFPLLSVAVIYFLISFGILSLLKYFEKRLSPKRVRTQEVEK